MFKQNRYDRELGGVYLHWSQVGKTLYEVFRDEHAPEMTDALCSEINHQKYYSGEFDIEWGRTITEKLYEFKKLIKKRTKVIPNKVIMAVRGHSAEKQFLKYIGEVESDHLQIFIDQWSKKTQT